MIPLFAIKLVTKLVLVPVVVLGVGAGSLIVPKHYNLSTYPVGDYKGYHYSAKVMEHPVLGGIGNSRVEQIKVTKNGRIVMDFYQGWRVHPSDPVLEKLVKKLDQEMASKHKGISPILN